VKPKEPKSKRTYNRDELNQLLLKEAFERDLTLFSSLVTRKEGLFEQPMVDRDWTFTVVKDSNGDRELFINIPTSKK
jgi:hypothetical protein